MESGSAGKFKGKSLDEIEVNMDEDLLDPENSLCESGLMEQYDEHEEEVFNEISDGKEEKRPISNLQKKTEKNFDTMD